MELVDNAINAGNSIDYSDLFKPKIMVCGIGGGGSNTVNRISALNVRGAALVAVNTDSKHLNSLNPSIKKILIGGSMTRGLGAGGFPEMGKKAAEYSRTDILSAIHDSNLLFLCAGMGGGTGTGAAPVVAEAAKEQGAIVISVVTYPFSLERVRLKVAREGIAELGKKSDTVIVIDNQKLVDLYPNLAIEQAFKVADEVASRAVVGITETITTPSLINLDFADVRSVMSSGGLAMISVGEGHGSDRVREAINSTLRNKLLDVDYENATGVLLHITGGPDMTLGDANAIGAGITGAAAADATILWGARIDPTFEEKIQVIAIFTGVRSPSILGQPSAREDAGFGLEEI